MCRSKKLLYGLKQEPRAWYARMDACVQILGFSKSSFDLNIYIKDVKDVTVIILLYVDALPMIGVEGHIQDCKKQLTKKNQYEGSRVDALLFGVGSLKRT